MSNELSKNLMCVCMRNGVEIWIEEEKIDDLLRLLEIKKFTKIGKELINSADVTGIFDAKTMREKTMIKMGYWKCEKAQYWHKRHEECGH